MTETVALSRELLIFMGVNPDPDMKPQNGRKIPDSHPTGKGLDVSIRPRTSYGDYSLWAV